MGILYLLQPVEYHGTSIFKIGCSKSPSFNRVRYGYKPQSWVIAHMACADPFIYEEELIQECVQQFTRVKGREYFSGDLQEAFKIFCKISSKGTSKKIQQYQEQDIHETNSENDIVSNTSKTTENNQDITKNNEDITENNEGTTENCSSCSTHPSNDKPVPKKRQNRNSKRDRNFDTSKNVVEIPQTPKKRIRKIESHTCPYCKHVFTRSDTYQRHMKRITPCSETHPRYEEHHKKGETRVCLYCNRDTWINKTSLQISKHITYCKKKYNGETYNDRLTKKMKEHESHEMTQMKQRLRRIEQLLLEQAVNM